MRQVTQIILIMMAVLTVGCQKTAIPAEYSQMPFTGIDAVSINSAGNLELTWSPVAASSSGSGDVTYSVYVAEITSTSSGLAKMTADTPGSQQSIDLESKSQPKNAGKLLTATSSQKYVMTEGLESGKLYGFQVIAKSAGKIGDNNRVLAIYYAKAGEDTTSLTIARGNFQSSTPSATLAYPLVVELTKKGAALSGEIITFSISDGVGTLSASNVVTDVNGRASVSYTAPATTANSKVTAFWEAGQKTVEFTVLASSSGGGGYALAAQSGNFQLATVLNAFTQPLKVKLTNGGVATSGKTITFSLTSGSGATLSSTTATTDASGFAQVNVTAGATAGAYVIHASYNSDEASADFQLIAQADTRHLDIISGNYQSGTVSTQFATPLKVRLLATPGATDPVSGASIAFAVTTGSATLSAAAATTDASGYAQVDFTAGSSTGTYVVTATHSSAAGNVSAVFYLIGTAVPDTKILEVVGGNFQVDAKSTTFANALQARLKDGSSPVSGQSVSFSITSQPSGATGASLSAASATTNASGIAQVSFTSGNKDGTYEITASWTDGTVTKSATFAEVAQTNTAATSKILKIVASGAGAQPEITTATLDLVADTLAVKAALYDLTGTTYISDANVAWSLTGGGFNSADLSGIVSNSTSITFDPTRTGSTVLSATYLGSDTTVVGTTDSTGFLTVNTTLIPGVISQAAGTGQSAVVNTTLPVALKVRVMSAGAVPVPGASVNFSNTQGGGVVTTGQPVLTDADGYAQATVQLGTTAMTNIFRAAVVGYGSLTYDFTATATPGAATKLAFSTQPANAFQNFMFLTQPIVVIQDTYGNLITTANYPINLTKGLGAGTFVGTTTATAVNGVATFQNVGWNTQENGITIVANSTPTLTTATSNSLNVAAPLASSCATESTNFKTQEGGCKDQSTGYVWSNVTPGTWYNGIWDASVAGAAASDANDNGWTNEYSTPTTSTCAGGPCDAGSGGYCHDLTLGGYSDWFLPSYSMLSAARSNGISTAITNANTWTWTTDTWDSTNRFNFNLGTLSTTGSSPGASYNVICARAGTGAPPRFPTPTKWAWTTTPTVATVGQTFTAVAQIQTAASTGVNRQNQSVTVSLASGTGTLGGTTTVNTDSQGQARFTDLTYSVAGEYFTLRVTGGTYTSATTTNIYTTTVAGGCSAPDDVYFDTYQGGCRDKGTGVIWSKLGTTGMNWHSIFWDAATAGASPPDANDNGWSNDYQSTSTTPCTQTGNVQCDGAAGAYCHDLVEGGYSDWTMPTLSQLQTARANGLHNRNSYGTAYVWSIDSYTVAGSLDYAYGYRFSDGAVSGVPKGNAYYPVCIRGGTPRPAAYRVEFESTASRCLLGQTCGNIYARIVTSTGAQVNRSGVSVTIAVASGTGNLGGTLTAITDRAGRALFNNFTFDTSGSVTLSLSNDASLVNGSNMTLMTSSTPGACMVENTFWTTVDGGCKHIPSGKVFSKSTTTTYYWSDAIWDSTVSGSAAPDADDGVRVNDYDGTHQAAGKDNLATAYCHNLNEGGKTDWRVPSNNEFVNISANNPRSAIAGPAGSSVSVNTYFWTATQGTWGYCGDNNKYVFNLFSEVSVNDHTKGKGIGDGCYGALTNYIICVRP